MRPSNTSRDSSVCDCNDAHAPIWLGRGREAKYASASAAVTGSTLPSIFTWMPSRIIFQ